MSHITLGVNDENEEVEGKWQLTKGIKDEIEEYQGKKEREDYSEKLSDPICGFMNPSWLPFLRRCLVPRIQSTWVQSLQKRMNKIRTSFCRVKEYNTK